MVFVRIILCMPFLLRKSVLQACSPNETNGAFSVRYGYVKKGYSYSEPFAKIMTRYVRLFYQIYRRQATTERDLQRLRVKQ